MARTDVYWAGRISGTDGTVLEGARGYPDVDALVVADGRSFTYSVWTRAAYDELAALFAEPIAGDAVSPDSLRDADVLAFELNGGSPAPSGGWESCDWVFTDGPNTVGVRWNEALHEVDGSPVRRDPRVIANGSIRGETYGRFFGTVHVPGAVVSFLLFRVHDRIDVTSPAFSVTIRGVPAVGGLQEATPDPDAVGFLIHPPALPPPPDVQTFFSAPGSPS